MVQRRRIRRICLHVQRADPARRLAKHLPTKLTLSAMKKKIQNACALAGGTTLLIGAGVATENPIAIIGWLVVSVSLLYAGKAFSFQQNQ